MKKNIEELNPDHHVFRTCTNGKQVLECCLEQQVDVLFTDIRMPVMGGIELLQKLADNQALPYTIILSAHDDFSYARDCFKLGVREFLLKSEITKEILEQCLKTAALYLESIRTEEQGALSKAEQWEGILWKYFQKPDAFTVDEIKQQWKDFCEIEGDFLVIRIESSSKAFCEERFREMASFLFQEEDLRFYCISNAEKELAILSECPHESVNRFVVRLYQVLASFGYEEIRINASDRGHTWEELKSAYLQAEEVLEYQSFYLQYGAADYTAVRESKDAAGEELEQMFKSLEEQIFSRQWEEAEPELKKLFLFMRTARPSVSAVKQVILNYLFDICWDCQEEEKRIHFSIRIFTEFCNCPDIDVLEKKFMDHMEQFASMREKKNPLYSEPVHGMIRYMEEHYEAAISLEELANYVHMNRSYVSHLFKKETGVNIYQYLLTFRMEKAKLLLLDHKNSVQQICRQIGIPDSAYFSKLFKKHVGMSPLEFRKMSRDL